MKLSRFATVMLALVILGAPSLLWATPNNWGSSGLFTLSTSQLMPKGGWQVGVYGEKTDRMYQLSSTVNSPGYLARTKMFVDTYHYSLVGGYSFFNWFEVGVRLPYTVVNGDFPFDGQTLTGVFPDALEDTASGQGLGDIGLTLKFRLYENNTSRWGIAAVVYDKVPTGDTKKNLGTGGNDVGAKLALSKWWNRAGLHFNAGYLVAGSPKVTGQPKNVIDTNNVVNAGLGLDICPGWNWKIIAEAVYETKLLDSQRNSRSNTSDTDPKADSLDGILGFRYFFSKDGQNALHKHAFSIGASVRYAFMEETQIDGPALTPGFTVAPDKKSNPIGFLAHLTYSPRLQSDVCKIVPKSQLAPPRNYPPSVVVEADPPSHEITKEDVEAGFAVTSKVTANASDRDGDALTYKWSLKVDDKDEEELEYTVAEFNYTFTKLGIYKFTCVVDDGHDHLAQDSTTVSVTTPQDVTAWPIVYFEFDKSVIRDEYKAACQKAKEILDTHPDMVIQIQGFTCPMGTDEYNMALGDRRAKSVYNYLKALGVDMNRLSTISYGEDPAYLVVKVGTKAELSPNRRGEFKVVNEEKGGSE